MTSSRKEPLWLGGFFVGIVLCACLFSPALFWLGHEILPKAFPPDAPGALGEIRKDLVESPFSRYFNRSLTFTALILIWPVAKRLTLSGTARQTFGLTHGVQLPKALLLGFGFGAGSLVLLGWWLTQKQLILLKPGVGFWSGSWSAPLMTGWGVGVIEEILFRGVLLGAAMSVMRPFRALALTSVIFAVVHFLKATDAMEIPDASVSWQSGFVLLGRMFSSFGEFRFLFADFATLLIVGFALGWFRLATGAVWGPVALHAGWVFGLKHFADVTRPHRWATQEQLMPLLGNSLRSGLIPLAIISLTWLLLRHFWPKKVIL